MWGLPQKQNARRAYKIRLCGHLRRYKKIVKKTYIIYIELSSKNPLSKLSSLETEDLKNNPCILVINQTGQQATARKEPGSCQKTYCAFWEKDNSGYYIEESADILKSCF